MKKRIAVAAFWVCAMKSAYVGNADFTLVNQTGLPIKEIFVSPSLKKDWSEDRLRGVQMRNGESRKFSFGDVPDCQRDIKVVFAGDGSNVEWVNINLCKSSRITLWYDHRTNDVTTDQIRSAPTPWHNARITGVRA